MACAAVNSFGKGTSQSPLTRAFCKGPKMRLAQPPAIQNDGITRLELRIGRKLTTPQNRPR